MAHIPVKRKVRDTRVNEIVRTQKPPFPYHQPKSHIPIIPFKTSIEMRNILKATTLENKFPLFTVENGCIVSKDADITVAFRVELPELFTVTAAEYEAIHSAWNKAVKVLPDYSIVHKQDWFIKENYAPDIQKDDLSFLSRSFERHFNERPFLNHTCYLFLTKRQRNVAGCRVIFLLFAGASLSQEIKGQGNGYKVPRSGGAV